MVYDFYQIHTFIDDQISLIYQTSYKYHIPNFLNLKDGDIIFLSFKKLKYIYVNCLVLGLKSSLGVSLIQL